MDLLDSMILALDLGLDDDELETRCRSKNHETTFIRLLEQISECGHFIQSYVINDKFCRNPYSSTHTKMLTLVLLRATSNEKCP